MQLAVKHRDPSHEAYRKGSSQRLKRYAVLSQLAAGQRAEILLGLPQDADSLDKLVVIKIFSAEQPGTGLAEPGVELSLASQLEHENIARTLSIGFESKRYFMVSEYLEGVTLRALLRWAHSVEQAIPSAAVVRILRAILHALEHAAHRAGSAEARGLINQPLAADNVFITYDGSVKLLGFKPVQRLAPDLRAVPDDGRTDELRSAAGDASEAQNAIDALLSSQRTPALGQLLARLASPALASPEDWVSQVRDALDHRLSDELGSDGQAELAAIMCRVWPEARAREAAKIQAAFDELRARKGETSRQLEEKAENAPVSQYRARHAVANTQAPDRATSNAPAVLLAEPGLNAPDVEPLAPPPSASRRLPWLIIAAALAGATLAGASAIYLAGPGDAPGPGAPTQKARALLEETAVYRARAPSPPVPDRAVVVVKHEDASVRPPPARAEPSRTVVRRATRPATPPGYLTLDTTPWSNVSLRGVSLGQTPLVGVEMEPGEHLLELVNSELDITSRYVVNITSGAKTVRRIGLEQPKSRWGGGEP